MDEANPLVQLQVRALLLDPDSKTPVVVLEDPQGGILLPIWIGPFEGLALSRALQGQAPDRPQTHELLASVVRQLSQELVAAEIIAIEGTTFIARLRLATNEGTVLVDSRPSDAITLATSLSAPIFAAREVLQQGKCVLLDQAEDLDEQERMRRLLESLEPEDHGGYTM